MNRLTILSVLIAVGIIVSAFVFSDAPTDPDFVEGDNVVVEEGVQIVTIRAKGGYIPEKSVAAAGIPTTLRIVTNGTFDCSSIVRIPSIDLTEYLQPTGTLDIDLGTPAPGIFRGSCGMGMYPFEIDFQ
ncbi:MAG: hypothetical protein AMXMBFR44_0480 [Candidatus Campbellbacteria bacterium]